jgi:hypothetical protein
MARTLTATALLMSLAVPAHAHTEDELGSWLVEFERMKAETPVPPWPSQAWPIVSGWDALLQDMRDRHPCSEVLGTPCPASVPRQTFHTRGMGSETHRGMGSDVEQWRSLVEAYFGANTDAALRVMACESGGNPNAANPRSSASGLFQFLASTWERTTGEAYPGNVFDAESNIAAAAKLSKGGSDWRQWSCRP